MSGKNNGGQALPVPCPYNVSDKDMTLRDYFAAKAEISWGACVEMLERENGASPTVEELANYIAEMRYVFADAMMAVRET